MEQGDRADEFRVEFTWGNSAIVVSFAGELDISATRDMRAIFSDPGVLRAPAIDVDLTQATFLDSSGVGVLVSACRQKRDAGGLFSVICSPGPIKRRFEMTGLIDYLKVRDPK